MKKVAPNLVGRSFGRLVVVSRAQNIKNCSRWECKCACGNTKLVMAQQLLSGNTKSCGCLHKEQLSRRVRKHGLSGTKDWWVWSKIKDRCCRPQDASWPNYGGRGITICERWKSDFLAFMADMGPRPSPQHSIERRDNNGPYSPENCYWATDLQQAANKRNNVYLTHGGETYHMSEWARKLGLKPDQLKYLIRRRKLSLTEVIKIQSHRGGLAIAVGDKEPHCPDA